MTRHIASRQVPPGDTHDHQSLFSHNQCREGDFGSIEGFHCGRGEVKECSSLPKTLLPGTALRP
jgi:hypothetical protein